ncbi:MAG: DUF547 domain-containing protein [Xanthomonadales bacterium]|nr:DUF547 domain-containing protein [Xanthomonadales bacterium]
MLRGLLLCLLVLYGGQLLAQAEDASDLDQVWNQLLQRHVQWSQGGHASTVDYDGLAGERERLQAYLRSLSAIPEAEFRGWPAPRRASFLINAYNAWTVELILQADTRPASIKDLGGWLSTPWRQPLVQLFGQTLSLDEVEHERLRGDPEQRDPRIHFAVNCASIGCPALRPEAFRSEQLDAQLADQTQRFLGDRSRNHLDGSVLRVSPIFKWYAEDFERGWRDQHSVVDFLAAHAGALGLTSAQADQLRSGALRLRYSDYDWRLNSDD